jgi:hypothetical protein
MKTIQYLFFVAMATLLMAADCSNKDSEFYNDVFVSKPGLVTLENTSSSITVIATIPSLLEVDNQTNLLDIFKTTGGATKMNFSYVLEKQDIEGNWDYIEVPSANLVITKGECQTGSFIFGSAVYNSTTTNYEYSVGFQSLTSGNYRLSFGFNNNTGNLVSFRSESINNNLFLNLNTTAPLLDSGGFYPFTII